MSSRLAASFRGASLLAALAVAAGCEGHTTDDLGAPLAVTFRASILASGQEPDGHVSECVLSADGRYAAFTTGASNLVSGDANGVDDVYVRDTVTGAIVRVSLDPAGVEFVDPCQKPAISADGRYVAFEAGPRGTFDTFIYRRDLVAGTTVLASEATTGGTPGRGCYEPSISANGQFIAFESGAFDLIASGGPASFQNDIIVRDMNVPAASGGNEWVSQDETGGEAGAFSYNPSISADGRYVAFSSGQDLVTADTNGWDDVYVRDRQNPPATGLTFISDGLTANGDDYSFDGVISADGNWVAWMSLATNLVAGDTNGIADVFVRARTGGPVIRVSVHTSGAQSQSPILTDIFVTPFEGGSFGPAISGDGRYVGFYSDAVNLVDADTNQAADVFVRDVVAGRTMRVSVRTFGQETLLGSRSLYPAFSSDGRWVAFVSEATSLVDGDTNGLDDAFIRGPLQ